MAFFLFSFFRLEEAAETNQSRESKVILIKSGRIMSKNYSTGREWGRIRE
jgi:hypothetical protein